LFGVYPLLYINHTCAIFHSIRDIGGLHCDGANNGDKGQLWVIVNAGQSLNYLTYFNTVDSEFSIWMSLLGVEDLLDSDRSKSVSSGTLIRPSVTFSNHKQRKES
jgi:hypothetical protein